VRRGGELIWCCHYAAITRAYFEYKAEAGRLERECRAKRRYPEFGDTARRQATKYGARTNHLGRKSMLRPPRRSDGSARAIRPERGGTLRQDGDMRVVPGCSPIGEGNLCCLLAILRADAAELSYAR